MSRATPPRGSPTPPRVDSPGGGSPRTPRGGRLRDRVTFFEQVWSAGRTPSAEDLLDDADVRRSSFRSPTHRRSSSRASDSSFEESFERLVEEGELNGTKVVKFEKITVRKSVREISSNSDTVLVQQRALTESSRTPSEEHALEDSAYQSHSHGVHSHGSKSSSVTSFARFPSEESIPLSQRRCSSPRAQQLAPDDRPPSEWYAEYRNQSFQNVAARIEYVRSRSEYDAHIAEIKGTAVAWSDDRESLRCCWILVRCLSTSLHCLRSAGEISSIISTRNSQFRYLRQVSLISGCSANGCC